jgi:7-carboxy-7-deazaguanine synthase
MKVHSIFSSLQGEGRFQGVPTLFIRLYGCNLRCSYCDAIDAVSGDVFFEMTVKEVFKKVNEYDFYDICITGGEPMCQKDELYDLLRVIGKERRVSLETNGSFDLFELTDFFPEVYVSVDWKTPGSGTSSFCAENLKILEKKDRGWIKFVVSSKEDLGFIKQKTNLIKGIDVYVSPVYENGEIFFKDVSEFVLDNKNLKFQLQLHKIIGID